MTEAVWNQAADLLEERVKEYQQSIKVLRALSMSHPVVPPHVSLPEMGAVYYAVTAEGDACRSIWAGDSVDHQWYDEGRVHRTIREAREHPEYKQDYIHNVLTPAEEAM